MVHEADQTGVDDACSASAPCRACGRAPVDEEHADRALRFAVALEGGRSEYAAPFWRVASIAERYFRSDRGGRHRRTDAYVRRVMDASAEFSDVLGMHPDGGGRGAWRALLSGDDSVQPVDDGTPLFGDELEGADGTSEDEEESTREEVPSWKPLLDSLEDGGSTYSPGQGGDSDIGGSPACKVKRWAYPYYWSPQPPSGAKTSNRRGVGFYFEAEVEFDDVPPQYLCSCCVFRQFIRATVGSSSVPAAGWRRDQETGGKEYGGARIDGSTGASPDAPERERGEYSADGCILSFDDRPRKRGLLGSGTLELTWDFVGVVYDRCNNWAFVDARRFLFWRKVTLAPDGEGGYVVTDTDGSPALHKDVSPESGDAAWTHNSPGRSGQMPGTNMPRPPKSAAKRMLERERRRRAAKGR